MLWSNLLLTLWMVHYSVAQVCPEAEALAPSCMCKTIDSFSMMSCSNIKSAEELINPIKATQGYDMLSLNIDDSSVPYIPSEAFIDTKFAKISFGNSHVMSLSNGALAFEGLENYLEELRAIGDNNNATWNWNQLRNHKKLDLIDVNNIALNRLGAFPSLLSLKYLAITRAEISSIHPFALMKLKSLTMLILKENKITDIQRNMLPTPADKLYLLDLSHNQLKSLHKDAFSNMPHLKEVMLNHNQFTSLSSKTFSDILNRLDTMLLNGNKIRCDCLMRWLINQRFPALFQGECDSPENLRGRSLKEIKKGELECA